MKNLTRIGFVITGLWLGAFLVVLIAKADSLRSLELNEWGDFLAGVTAPLALIWIVIGYFLQGEELRLNTEALKAQHDELKRQVAETAILGANSDRQAKAAEQMAFISREESERARLQELAGAQPVFRARGGQQTGGRTDTDIRNVGATITNITVTTEEHGVSIDFAPRDVLEEGGEARLQISGATRFPLDFTLSYTDQLGHPHTKHFEMTRPHVLMEKIFGSPKI